MVANLVRSLPFWFLLQRRALRPPPSLSPPSSLARAEGRLQLGKIEVDAYDRLVNDCGRPLYPIEFLDDVSASFPTGPIRGPNNQLYYVVTGDPYRHQELLRPWLEDIAAGRYFDSWHGETRTEYPWEIFQKQWMRWVMFRRWQKDNRDLADGDGGLEEYLEVNKRYAKRYYGELVGADELSKLEDDQSWLERRWKYEQQMRELQRHHCCESRPTGPAFPNYVDAVKRRLARHDFKRPFELNQDPEQQGKLETWIEYLYFEYWWLDLFTLAIEQRQQKCDEVWRKLGDAAALRPGETTDYIRTEQCAMLCVDEERQARADVKRAKEIVEDILEATRLDLRRPSSPQSERIPRLQQGHQGVDRAQMLLERAMKRSGLIKEFKSLTDDLETAKRNAARHRILLQWILDQVPLIEAELGRNEIVSGLDGIRGSKAIKRKLGGSDGDKTTCQTGIEKRRKLGPSRSNGMVILDSEIQQKQVVPFIVSGTGETPPRDKQQRSQAREPRARHLRRTQAAREAAREAASQGLRRSARKPDVSPFGSNFRKSAEATTRGDPVQPARVPPGRGDAKLPAERKKRAMHRAHQEPVLSTR